MRNNNFCKNSPHDNSKAPAVVMVHNYNNVSVVSQGSHAHFENAVSNSEENMTSENLEERLEKAFKRCLRLAGSQEEFVKSFLN